MPAIRLQQVTAAVSDTACLESITFAIGDGEQWAVVGANGSGKSSFGRLLCNELEILSGSCSTAVRAGFVSFEKVKEALEWEREHDDSDFLDCPDPGTSVTDFILGKGGEVAARDKERLAELAAALRLESILERGIKLLSTGEMRKVAICRALMQDPELLVLDEPFDGVDAASCAMLRGLIAGCMARGVAVVLLLNRFSEILPEVTHVAYIKDCRILVSGARGEILGSEALRRCHDFHYTLPARLPATDPATAAEPLAPGTSPVVMREVTVAYDGKTVLNRLTWRVGPGEHWKISGPNGSGKSTLLSLVSGDHPQAYANDITLFGIRRGSGESVWDIKKRIGVVSTVLQQDYRVGVTVKIAVLSGFFDSIGVYGDYTRTQEEIALEWLGMLQMERHLDAPFRGLSYGEQRLVLVARAMVKQPELLILDEPCQGLDDVNREMVLKLVDHLGRTGRTQILYVTHHAEDRIPCIERHLELVPADGGGCTGIIRG